VGGSPTDVALELLGEQERIERGWYAGPVGWVDADGAGEFVVGIRSAVVDGVEASLFVGCGIVGDSDPAHEWQESVDKSQLMARALAGGPA
jgi:menaquinone-specific isochorismate synthase